MISESQIAEAEAEKKKVPRISFVGHDGFPWFVFTNFSVPANQVIMVSKSRLEGRADLGEALVTVVGHNGGHPHEYPTGDQYDNIPQEMFR